jgi:hypothetical protein
VCIRVEILLGSTWAKILKLFFIKIAEISTKHKKQTEQHHGIEVWSGSRMDLHHILDAVFALF